MGKRLVPIWCGGRVPVNPSKTLEKAGFCIQIDDMETVTYSLRIPKPTFKRVEQEAKRRHKQLSVIFREAIDLGIPQLPPLMDMDGVVADTWDKLGPAPDIDYGQLSETSISCDG